MTKKMIVVMGATAAVVIGGAGGWYWLEHRVQSSAVAADGSPVSLDTTTTAQSKGVPIDNSTGTSPSQDPGALQVKPAQDLGQTNVSGGSRAAASGGSTASSSGSTSSSRELEPDKFVEYEKYKTAQAAMFGEIVVGMGADVVVGKPVAVNYRGWLTNGQMFDHSKEGSPFIFTPGDHRVILGWEQGIMGMKVGGKRLLIVPPAVGYGAAGKDPIPANAVLVFEIELVAVQP